MTDENNAKILAVHAWWNLSQRGNDIHFRFVHKKEQRPKEKVREKKYFCSLCGKAFLCPSSLAMHCRTHSGDKPFSCEQCGQAFAQAGNLKKHTKRWHENGEGRAPRYVCWPLLLPRRTTSLKFAIRQNKQTKQIFRQTKQLQFHFVDTANSKMVVVFVFICLSRFKEYFSVSKAIRANLSESRKILKRRLFWKKFYTRQGK